VDEMYHLAFSLFCAFVPVQKLRYQSPHRTCNPRLRGPRHSARELQTRLPASHPRKKGPRWATAYRRANRGSRYTSL